MLQFSTEQIMGAQSFNFARKIFKKLKILNLISLVFLKEKNSHKRRDNWLKMTYH